MPRQPRYQSRPSSRMGRQACAAMDTRISSVSSRPCVPANSFSARKRSTSSRSFGVAGRNERACVARSHSASSMRCLARTRCLLQLVSQPINRKIAHGLGSQAPPSKRGGRARRARRRSRARGPRAHWRGARVPAARARVPEALEFAEPLYAAQVLSTGEPTWAHALGLGANLAAIGLDAPGRVSGVLFAAPKHVELDAIKARFGDEVASLADGVERLYQLRMA